MTLDALTSRHTLTQALVDALRLEGQEPSTETREAMHRYLEGDIDLRALLAAVESQLKG